MDYPLGPKNMADHLRDFPKDYGEGESRSEEMWWELYNELKALGYKDALKIYFDQYHLEH